MIGLKKANAKYNTTFISHMVRKICNENSDLSKTVNESPKLGLSKISKSESLKSQQKETMHSWDLLSFLGDKKLVGDGRPVLCKRIRVKPDFLSIE